MVIIGAYKDVADMNEKYNAYMRFLTASSNIQRRNTEAFKRKLEFGDAPQPRDLDEMDIYKNPQEKLLDIQAQRKKARENLTEIFRRPKETDAFLRALADETSVDPKTGENIGNSFALFNVYFNQLKDTTKSFTDITPDLLLKYYRRLLDEQRQDLIANQAKLTEIVDGLNLLSRGSATLRNDINDILVKLKTELPTEKTMNEILFTIDKVRARTLDTDIAVSTIARQVGTSKSGFPAPKLPVKQRATQLGIPTRGKTKEQLEEEVASAERELRGQRSITEFTTKKGTGVEKRGRGRPRRIVGKGIEVVKRDVDWYNAGVYRVSRPSLQKNQLSVYYNKSLGRPNIRELKQVLDISDELKNTMTRLLKTQELHLPTFYKMKKADQALLLKFMKSAKMNDVLEEAFGADVPKIHSDEVDNAIHRFNLIQGQINAGQNNPSVLKELIKHTDTLYENGLMSEKDRIAIYKTVMSICDRFA